MHVARIISLEKIVAEILGGGAGVDFFQNVYNVNYNNKWEKSQKAG